MIGWVFPLNNGGQEHGPNHAGIETFLDDPLTSLAKEVCQNSCDAAAAGSGGPVEIHFTLDSLEADQIPGVKQLDKAVGSCSTYWQNNKKGQQVFARARAVTQAQKIAVLRISDYNTVGLTGTGGPEGRGSNWHNLIKAVGASDKIGGKLGSFGIGKHAPFACSAARAVLYSTRDREGSDKFQGVSILATHENDAGETTQAIGYYGEASGYREISSRSDIPEYFRRNRTGTDIFVLGFLERPDWEERVIHALLDFFFKAIYDGNLVVQVGSRRVNRNNLAEQLTELEKVDQELYAPMYFKSITDPNAHYRKIEDFEGLGAVELHLKSGPNYPKRVAIVRRSGMVVFHKGHFRTPLRFAGVLQLSGLAADEFFQRLEPPAHDKWETARHEKPALAQDLKTKLYKWINDCVRELSATYETDRQDVPGISEFLPDELDKTEMPFDETREGEKTDEPLPATIELHARKDQIKTDRSASTGREEGESDAGEALGGDPWRGDGNSDGGDGGIPSDDGVGGSGESDGDVDGPSEQSGEVPRKNRRPFVLDKQRTFCVDSGVYELVFRAPKDTTAYLSLRSVGETEAMRVHPASATSLDTGAELPIDPYGEIGPMELSSGEKYYVQIALPDQIRCALELRANED